MGTFSINISSHGNHPSNYGTSYVITEDYLHNVKWDKKMRKIYKASQPELLVWPTVAAAIHWQVQDHAPRTGHECEEQDAPAAPVTSPGFAGLWHSPVGHTRRSGCILLLGSWDLFRGCSTPNQIIVSPSGWPCWQGIKRTELPFFLHYSGSEVNKKLKHLQISQWYSVREVAMLSSDFAYRTEVGRCPVKTLRLLLPFECFSPWNEANKTVN